MDKPIIGQWYKANVTEPRWMIGRKFLLVAICKTEAPPDSDEKYITDDIHLAKVGGPEPGDLACVQAYHKKLKRPSYVEDQIYYECLEPTDAPELVEPDGLVKVGHAWTGQLE